jgi:hypothetical protein
MVNIIWLCIYTMAWNDADEIIDRLWLGNYNSSQDINFLRKNNITVIINCTKDLPILPLSGVYKYRLPVHDNLEHSEIATMTELLANILPKIDRYYRSGRSILIHCAAGMQRSAITVLCYLYQHHPNGPGGPVHATKRRRAQQCLQLMRERRPIVFRPYMNFALCFYRLYGQEAYLGLV